MTLKPVIFLGDSLTEWGPWEILFPQSSILNYGKAGNKTSDILFRLKDLYSENPSSIFFMAGINDIGDNISIEIIGSNIRKIISKLIEKWNKVELFLLSVLPVSIDVWENPAIKNEKIIELNKIIKQIANDFNCRFLNLHSAFTDEQGNLDMNYSNDGLHLNLKGYEVWNNEIKSYVH